MHNGFVLDAIAYIVQVGLTELMHLCIKSTIVDHFPKWNSFQICTPSLHVKNYTGIKGHRNLVLCVHFGGKTFPRCLDSGLSHQR